MTRPNSLVGAHRLVALFGIAIPVSSRILRRVPLASIVFQRDGHDNTRAVSGRLAGRPYRDNYVPHDGINEQSANR